MNSTGPILENLMRRLGEIPQDFLEEPKIGNRGSIATAAVVNDVFQLLGHQLPAASLTLFHGKNNTSDRNRLGAVLVFCWLLADEWFIKNNINCDKALESLTLDAPTLATQIAYSKLVIHPDRREEVVRTVLNRLGICPGGESPVQAQDRLASISLVERARVIEASKANELREEAIRKALAKKAADEAADKWTRE